MNKLSDDSLIYLLNYHKFLLILVSEHVIGISQAENINLAKQILNNIIDVEDIVFPKLPLDLFKKEKSSSFSKEERVILIDCIANAATLIKNYISFAKNSVTCMQNTIGHLMNSKLISEHRNSVVLTYNYLEKLIVDKDLE